MNKDDKKQLALLTRDQGLADLLFARDCMVSSTSDGRSTKAHVAIGKIQQSSEKVLKGYFLYHDVSINPFRRHDPHTQVMEENKGGTHRICVAYRTNARCQGRLFDRIKTLEGMAPSPPTRVNEAGERSIIPLDKLELCEIGKNTEYPFWDPETNKLTIPAVHFKEIVAVGWFRDVTKFYKTFAEADNVYEQGLQRFIEDHIDGYLESLT